MTTEAAIAPLVMSVKQVADALLVSPNTVYTLANEGKLPCVRIGRQLRFPLALVQSWLEQQATGPFDDGEGPASVEVPVPPN